jgi:hypothetical protein
VCCALLNQGHGLSCSQREKQRPMIRSIRTLRIRQLTGFDLSMFVPTSPLWIHYGWPESFSWDFAGVSPPGQLRDSLPSDDNNFHSQRQ